MRFTAVLVVVLLALSPSLARAQQPPPDQGAGGLASTLQWASSPSGVVYPGLNSQPFGTEHLLGDWWGARTWLEDHGIYVGLNYYPEVAAIIAGGQQQGVDYTSQIGLSVDLDGQKMFGLNGFAIHNVIVQRNGRSASADFLDDDLDAVQQIFGGGGSVAAHLVYLYGEQQFYSGRVNIAGGWLPVGSYFGASPIYCQFVNVIFCGNPHPLPVYPGEPDWPAASWGGLARVFVLPTFYVMGGVFQVNPNNGGPSGWDLFIHGTTGVSVPLEVGWTPSFGPNQLIGHYKVGFDNDSSSYPNLLRQRQRPADRGKRAGGPAGARAAHVLCDGGSDAHALWPRRHERPDRLRRLRSRGCRRLAVRATGVRGPARERELHRPSPGTRWASRRVGFR